MQSADAKQSLAVVKQTSVTSQPPTVNKTSSVSNPPTVSSAQPYPASLPFAPAGSYVWLSPRSQVQFNSVPLIVPQSSASPSVNVSVTLQPSNMMSMDQVAALPAPHAYAHMSYMQSHGGHAMPSHMPTTTDVDADSFLPDRFHPQFDEDFANLNDMFKIKAAPEEGIFASEGNNGHVRNGSLNSQFNPSSYGFAGASSQQAFYQPVSSATNSSDEKKLSIRVAVSRSQVPVVGANGKHSPHRHKVKSGARPAPAHHMAGGGAMAPYMTDSSLSSMALAAAGAMPMKRKYHDPSLGLSAPNYNPISISTISDANVYSHTFSSGSNMGVAYQSNTTQHSLVPIYFSGPSPSAMPPASKRIRMEEPSPSSAGPHHMYHQMNSDANGSSLLQTMSVSMSFPTQKQRDEAYSAGPHVASNGAALRGSTGSISNGIAGALFSLHNRQNGGALVGSQPYGGMSGSMPQEDKSLAPVFQSLDHQPQHMTIYDQRPTPLSSPRQQQGGSYPSLMEKHAHASVAIPVSADMTQFDPSAALPALDVSSAFIPMGDGGADFSSARAAPKATGAHVSPRTASPHTSPRTQAKNTKVKVEGSPTSTADAESLSPTSANLIGSQIFVCSFAGCGKEFSSRYSHRRHMKNHTGERPHVCPFDNCESKFAERSTLVRHIRVHTGEKPYKCSFIGCNRAFADRTNVKRHLLTHTGTKPYPCTYPDCNRSYSRKCYLTKHMVSVHNYTKPENCSDHDSDSDDGGSDDSDFDEPEDGGARGGSLLSGSAAAATSCLL